MNNDIEKERAYNLEREKEAEKWLKVLENRDSGTEEILKADFELEEILFSTENLEMKKDYVEKMLSLMEKIQAKKKLNYREEILAVHLLLTAGEVIKDIGGNFIRNFAPRIYALSYSPSSVISGLAHQKFLEILGKIKDRREKEKILQGLYRIIAQRQF